MRLLLIVFVACLVRVNSEAVPQHQENTEASTGNENSVTEVTTSTIIGTTVSTEAEVKLENSTPLNNVGAINQMLENENKATAIAENESDSNSESSDKIALSATLGTYSTATPLPSVYEKPVQVDIAQVLPVPAQSYAPAPVQSYYPSPTYGNAYGQPSSNCFCFCAPPPPCNKAPIYPPPAPKPYIPPPSAPYTAPVPIPSAYTPPAPPAPAYTPPVAPTPTPIYNPPVPPKAIGPPAYQPAIPYSSPKAYEPPSPPPPPSKAQVKYNAPPKDAYMYRSANDDDDDDDDEVEDSIPNEAHSRSAYATGPSYPQPPPTPYEPPQPEAYEPSQLAYQPSQSSYASPFLPETSYTYPSPPPQVNCGENLLFGCSPTVAETPCSPPNSY